MGYRSASRLLVAHRRLGLLFPFAPLGFAALAFLLAAFQMLATPLLRFLLRLGIGVDEVHRRSEALPDDQRNGLKRPIFAGRQLDALIARRDAQYVVDRLHARITGTTDADAQAWK